jgi:nucleoside-diphosphate-sugar epimerase
MRVFVTGHRGFIGAHLVELLTDAGHRVTGCDLGLFDGCEWGPLTPAHRELVKDVRDLDERDLDGHDCVMHLAAISNDPMGELDAGLTTSVNRGGSVHVAKVARRAGVPRFLFSGSCSVYGKGARADLCEDDPLDPITAYARSKVEAEAEISKLADRHFSPVYLRNATAFGDSPMLRIDLVANNLLASALAYGEIRVLSDGSPWRPLLHARDIARAFVALADAPRERVHDVAVNVGANDANFQVRDVAGVVAQVVPRAIVSYAQEAGPDPRDYRVCFGRLAEIVPEFRIAHPLAPSTEELCARMKERGFGAADFEGDRFVRLRTLRRRLDRLSSGRPRAESA